MVGACVADKPDVVGACVADKPPTLARFRGVSLAHAGNRTPHKKGRRGSEFRVLNSTGYRRF